MRISQCEICGRALEIGSPLSRRFCGVSCRARAYRKRETARLRMQRQQVAVAEHESELAALRQELAVLRKKRTMQEAQLAHEQLQNEALVAERNALRTTCQQLCSQIDGLTEAVSRYRKGARATSMTATAAPDVSSAQEARTEQIPTQSKALPVAKRKPR
jgi:SMC interacting uncharacterized protein involved in chromosome segregation